MNRAPSTQKGADLLKEELKHLKTVERPKIIDAVAEARAHGDLKENAEYHAAREQQSFTEGRIAELEGIISNSQVIDVASLNVGDRNRRRCRSGYRQRQNIHQFPHRPRHDW